MTDDPNDTDPPTVGDRMEKDLADAKEVIRGQEQKIMALEARLRKAEEAFEDQAMQDTGRRGEKERREKAVAKEAGRLKDLHDKAIKSLRGEHTTALLELQAKHRRDMENLQARHQEEVQALQEELKEVQRQHQTRLDGLARQHEEALETERRRTAYEKGQVTKALNEQEGRREQAAADLRSRMDRMEVEHEAAIRALEKANEDDAKAAEAELRRADDRVEQLQEEVEFWKTELHLARAALQKTIEQAAQDVAEAEINGRVRSRSSKSRRTAAGAMPKDLQGALHRQADDASWEPPNKK